MPAITCSAEEKAPGHREARPHVDNLLVLLAGLVFAVSIVCIVQAKQRAEAHHRARQRHEWDKLHGWQRHHRSAEGMIVALLADSGPGHIVVGGRTLWLRDGETCAYTGRHADPGALYGRRRPATGRRHYGHAASSLWEIKLFPQGYVNGLRRLIRERPA